MRWFRITKYDPRFRTGPGGAYTRDEWTSISDIGKSFAGRVLERDEYLAVESAYLRAARRLAADSGSTSMRIRGLESQPGPGLSTYTEGQSVPIAEALEITRQMLREESIWCRLEDDARFMVHVGYDYYMYVGAAGAAGETINRIRKSGLFVDEDWTSPYLD
jgi:hypothetical protein